MSDSSLPLPRRLAYRAWSAVPGPARSAGDQVLRLRAGRAVARQPWFVPGCERRVLVGPLNTAGQASAWARAIDAHVPGGCGLSLSAERRSSGAATFGYETDVHLDQPMLLRGMERHAGRVLGRGRALGATYVLAESGRSVLHHPWENTVLDDLAELEAEGIGCALVVHGSEMRDPSRHAEIDPASPFRAGDGIPDNNRAYAERLAALVERTRPIVEAFPGPVVVTTPDMLDHVPGAVWVPVVAKTETFHSAGVLAGPALGSRQPVVAHIPSSGPAKGTGTVDRVLRSLEDEGLVTYRSLRGLAHQEMPHALATADIVVDQIGLGNVGVLAAEAMAAGRLLVGHATEEVRERFREADPQGRDLPMVEATAETLEEVVRAVVADPGRYARVARRGPEWAVTHHDGRRTAREIETLVRR